MQLNVKFNFQTCPLTSFQLAQRHILGTTLAANAYLDVDVQCFASHAFQNVFKYSV